MIYTLASCAHIIGFHIDSNLNGATQVQSTYKPYAEYLIKLWLAV